MRVLSFTALGLLAFPFCSISPAQEAFTPIERRLPPPGTHLPNAEERRLLEERVRQLQRRASVSRGQRHSRHADAAVYLEAVRRTLAHHEFYHEHTLLWADEALHQAEQRLAHLERHKTPWLSQRGLSVAGFRSRLDDSVQPYGLEIPEQLDLGQPVPLYVWLHGRGDKKTDLTFIRERERKRSPFAFEDGITLHPFGRHCVGYKSAGEIDVLEAVEDVQQRYSIDENRVVLLGFSMGGAGAWHLGAHYTDRWAAVHAGAGFAETARYNRLQPHDYPPVYEQTLWRIYDVPHYARNFLNVPLVAYSGENDKQIQAAQVMEQALQIHGHTLDHVIGKGMGHKYSPEAIETIKARLGEHLQTAGSPRKQWHWQTHTLRYPGFHPWRITGLAEHYSDSRLDAERTDDGTLRVTTKNVTAFEHLGEDALRAIEIDGHLITEGTVPQFRRLPSGEWARGTLPGLRKRPGLQGPIDDAFLDPFLLVTSPQAEKVVAPALHRQWLAFEERRFQTRWQALFRGNVRTKPESHLSDKDREGFHLVLFGTPQTNPQVRRLLRKTPVRWTEEAIHIGQQRWDSAHHLLLMIYPNPEAPGRYLVLNSGPTFREGHDRTNSLQNPKLGDWAVIDVRQAPDALHPGRVVAAGCFDEAWQVPE